MQFNVAQLLKEPVGSTRSYALDKLSEYADSEKVGLEGRVRLLRTKRGILVKGVLKTRVSLMCSRCLTMFDQYVNIDIEEEFSPKIEVVSGAPLPEPEEPGAFTIDEYHILDLSEAVRQYTLLALPMKPLCYPSCAGLCPHCGANLNQGSCSCESRDKPPWAKQLEELLLTGSEN